VTEKCHKREFALHPADLKPENFEALPYHRLPCLQRVKTDPKCTMKFREKSNLAQGMVLIK
jgi:hypothetical protein